MFGDPAVQQWWMAGGMANNPATFGFLLIAVLGVIAIAILVSMLMRGSGGNK